MKKFAFAAVLTVAAVSYALGEELTVVISKVDGDKITYKKGFAFGGGKKGGKKKDAAPADPITSTVSSTVKVAKGVGKKSDDPDVKGLVYSEGDAIKDGLKDDQFTKIDAEKGLFARITIADDGADKGKVTKILVIDAPKFGKKKDAD
jgi:hypothetical protein